MKVRAPVSVCMATFNGSAYVHEQIQSIIPQLNPEDELIVVDDASTDNTIAIIEQFNDRRIKILLNKCNLGHVRTFERCLTHVTNEIIMFSDQDDRWTDDHIEKLLRGFDGATGPRLVFGDFQEFSDQNSLKIRKYLPDFPKSQITRLGFLRLLIMGKSRMFGCCMGINRELLDKVMPFPKRAVSHDLWIGYLAVLTAEINLVDQVITHRRIHTANITQSRRKLWLIVKERTYFISIMFYRWIF